MQKTGGFFGDRSSHLDSFAATEQWTRWMFQATWVVEGPISTTIVCYKWKLSLQLFNYVLSYKGLIGHEMSQKSLEDGLRGFFRRCRWVGGILLKDASYTSVEFCNFHHGAMIKQALVTTLQTTHTHTRKEKVSARCNSIRLCHKQSVKYKTMCPLDQGLSMVAPCETRVVLQTFQQKRGVRFQLSS